MPHPNHVTFYLPEPLRTRAAEGGHNFIKRLGNVLTNTGFTLAFHDATDEAAAAQDPGFAIFLMQAPLTPHGLTIRRTYIDPFWHIEQSAERWTWPVAQASFDASQIDPKTAQQFCNRWRKQLFGKQEPADKGHGYVFAPLQGQLLNHRSFQHCSPIKMLDILAKQEHRPILATLHPGEAYNTLERDALAELCDTHTHLLISDQPSDQLLRECDYLLTQNSSLALKAMFLHKPCALFARSDFHHICANSHDLGPGRAIQAARTLNPNYDAYLWWFLQDQAINAGRPEAETKIKAALTRCGWPI